jgi:hypothetical protein
MALSRPPRRGRAALPSAVAISDGEGNARPWQRTSLASATSAPSSAGDGGTVSERTAPYEDRARAVQVVVVSAVLAVLLTGGIYLPDVLVLGPGGG